MQSDSSHGVHSMALGSLKNKASLHADSKDFDHESSLIRGLYWLLVACLACADPEGFVRGGPTLTGVFVVVVLV